MKKQFKVIADVDYVSGYLRYGHYELTLNEEDKAEFDALDEDDKADYIAELGDFIIDEVSIEDRGPITCITVEEVKGE